MLAATRKLFAAIETFKGEAQGMADKLLGELRIGLSEALSDEVLQRIGEAIGRFRQRNQAVQIELVSAMPAELERRLLQDQLQLAIGYFSGSQTALDYRPLFAERQRLYCGRQHPLFARETVAASGLEDGDRVLPPTASAPPASPGSPASAARAANRSKVAWRSSSPVLTWAICPSTSPSPG